MSENLPSPIKTASLKSNITRITLHGVPHEAGLAAKFFKEIGQDAINVDDIIQNVRGDDKDVTMSFVVSAEQTPAAVKATHEIIERFGGAKIEVSEHLSRIRVVGMGMRAHSGVAAKLFEAVSNAGVNIENISTGEIVITVLVADPDGEKAIQAVRDAFGLQPDLEYE